MNLNNLYNEFKYSEFNSRKHSTLLWFLEFFLTFKKKLEHNFSQIFIDENHFPAKAVVY